MNKFVFCFIIMFCGCSNMEDVCDENFIGYTDYSILSVDKLSWQDKLLLENLDFRNGKYVCKLNKYNAIVKGIDEKKYQYFLEYIENQNAIIAEYINKGFTVTFENKSFNQDRKFMEKSNCYSKAVDGYFAAEKKVIAGPESMISFSAFNQLSITGTGINVAHWTIHMSEPYQGLRKILSGVYNNSATVYVQTNSANTFVDWDWKCELVNSNMRNPMITNQGYVNLKFYTSKKWNDGIVFNPVLPDYVSVNFYMNTVSVDIRDSIPEMFYVYYLEIVDKLSGALIYEKDIRYGSGIYNMPLQGDNEVIFYFYHAVYDSKLGKYVAGQRIAYQEFYVKNNFL